MSIKIAIPDKIYLKPLINNFPEVTSKLDCELIFKDENEIVDLLKKSEIDIGFLDPLHYGKLIMDDEFDLLSSTCFSAKGFTKFANIYFKENLVAIHTLAINNKEDYIATIAQILLEDKYNFDIKIEQFKDVLNYIPQECDAVLTTTDKQISEHSLDLTEEWYDNFEFELPIGFWVTAHQDDTELFKFLTNEIFDKNLNKKEEVLEEVHTRNAHYERSGEINYQFTDNTEKAIDDVLEILYQLGYLEEITDTRIS
jgi:predicted solute-binding protein